MSFFSAVVVASFVGATAFTAPRASSGVRSLSMVMEDRSVALPMDRRPPNLDGTLPGDVGFDPAGFSNNPPKFWSKFGPPFTFRIHNDFSFSDVLLTFILVRAAQTCRRAR